MTITCYACGTSCTGEVLKVQDRHFHTNCFTCKVCRKLLASGGYFMRNDDYFCSKDYHVLFGTKCQTCGEFVEGRVVTALGHSYHPHCFTCDRCKSEIRSGTVVTYNDRQEILCQKCTDSALNDPTEKAVESIKRETGLGQPLDKRSERQMNHDEYSRAGSYPTVPHDSAPSPGGHGNDLFDFSKVPDVDPVTRARMGKCAGCREPIRSCQSLIALDRHWHLFCFTCSNCNKLLTSEYMNKGDKPLCEPCYHELHGVICDSCQQYITGKVLEAGEKHYHPTCSTCCRCGLTFGEGEDMCIAGDDIWHLDCDHTKAEGIRADSETSSDESRSRSQTHSATSPSPTGSSGSRSQRSSSKLQMSRESSAGEPGEMRAFSLKELTTSNVRLPRGVDRTKLETYLCDEDFVKAFRVDRNTFYSLPNWKQINLKKHANLF